MSINLSADDYNEEFANTLVCILNHLSYSTPTEDEIWSVARQSEEVPNVANVYLGLLLDSVKSYCMKEGIDCVYYVNSLDSHLHIWGDSINSVDDFINAMKPENNSNLSINQMIIKSAGLEVIEDSGQQGMYCWIDSDFSYENKMMAEDALAIVVTSKTKRYFVLSDEKWDSLDISRQCEFIREYYE